MGGKKGKKKKKKKQQELLQPIPSSPTIRKGGKSGEKKGEENPYGATLISS